MYKKGTAALILMTLGGCYAMHLEKITKQYKEKLNVEVAAGNKAKQAADTCGAFEFPGKEHPDNKRIADCKFRAYKTLWFPKAVYPDLAMEYLEQGSALFQRAADGQIETKEQFDRERELANMKYQTKLRHRVEAGVKRDTNRSAWDDCVLLQGADRCQYLLHD